MRKMCQQVIGWTLGVVVLPMGIGMFFAPPYAAASDCGMYGDIVCEGHETIGPDRVCWDWWWFSHCYDIYYYKGEPPPGG